MRCKKKTLITKHESKSSHSLKNKHNKNIFEKPLSYF